MTKKSKHLKTKDYLVTEEEFELYPNHEQDMLITHPQPKNLERYYNSNNYISHKDTSVKIIDKIYRFVKLYTLNKKLKLISSFAKGQHSLLDIGTGTGEFVGLAIKKNWYAKGVEPNKKARAIAREKDLSIYSNLDEITTDKFQIITLWHVLEHLPDLNKQITQIKNLLHEEGTLIIAVPNYNSYDASHYGTYWAAYDTPRHLWHFSKNAITRIFKEHGLSVIEIQPMYFDSYYVSLLSEKHKTGKSNYIRAFYQGFISNLKAKRSGEYSSLIYILKTDKKSF